MEKILIVISVAEFGAMVVTFFGLRHRDRKIREEMNSAITFAFDMKNIFRAQKFLQAFRDNNTRVLNSEFPEWNAFRNDEPYGVEAI